MVTLLCLGASPEVPRIVRCGDLLTSLAREAKVTLDLPRSLGEHRVYLVRGDDSAQAAIRLVAKAIGASVAQSGTRIEIRRTAADERAIESRRRLQRTRWLEASLQRVAAHRKASALGRDPVAAALEARSQDLAAWGEVMKGRRAFFPATSAEDLLPASGLLRGMVQRIGIETIAGLPYARASVFEDRPVATAVPLPEHDDLSAAYLSDAEGFVAFDPDKAMPPNALGQSSLPFNRPPKDPSRLARLRVWCQWAENVGSVYLEAFDASGRRLDRSYLGASPSGTQLTAANLLRMRKDPAEARWKALSPEALDALRASASGPPQPPPAWFRDPVADEPLDLFVDEAVAGLTASPDHRAVAMDVDDGLWAHVRECVKDGRVDLDLLGKTLAEWLPYERLADADGTAWRLVDPEISERRRADRAALGRFARAVAASRDVEPRAVSRLFHDASPEEGTLVDAWLGVAGRVGRLPATSLDPETQRFLGAIPEDAWTRLLAGETLSVGALGIGNDLLRLFLTSAPWVERADGGPVPDLFRYPTELYPEGDLGPTTLAVGSVEANVLRFWSVGQPEPPIWTRSATMNRLLALSEISFVRQEGKIVCLTSREEYEKELDEYVFRNGVQTWRRLTLGLPQGYREVIGLSTRVEPDPATFAYRDLPQAVRDANWEKALRAGFADAQRRPLREIGPPVGPE